MVPTTVGTGMETFWTMLAGFLRVGAKVEDNTQLLAIRGEELAIVCAAPCRPIVRELVWEAAFEVAVDAMLVSTGDTSGLGIVSGSALLGGAGVLPIP